MADLTFDEAVKKWREKGASFIDRNAAEVWCRGLQMGASSEIVVGMVKGAERDREQWDGLGLFAQRLLRSGDPLPNELAAWVADVLAKKRRQPPKKRSKPKFFRDAFIVHAVRRLVSDQKFTEGRNLEPAGSTPCEKGGSALDVVGKVLGEKYYKTVGQALNRHKVEESRIRAWAEAMFDTPR